MSGNFGHSLVHRSQLPECFRCLTRVLGVMGGATGKFPGVPKGLTVFAQGCYQFLMQFGVSFVLGCVCPVVCSELLVIAGCRTCSVDFSRSG